MKNVDRISMKNGDRISMKNGDRVAIKNPRESKKSIRLSTARKEANNDVFEEPTPKISIRTRASSENNPEKMIRNVRSDIEQLKNKIKGRLAASPRRKNNHYH